MTNIQFTYMMGVLWLIFAGAIHRPDYNSDDLPFILFMGGFFLGLAHIGLAIVVAGILLLNS